MNYFLLLAIVCLAFLSLGLPDGKLGVAWPAIRTNMGQPLAAVGYITITMTICSAASSFWAGAITKRLGTGAVVASSCLLTGLGFAGVFRRAVLRLARIAGHTAGPGCGHGERQPEPLCDRG